MHYAHGELETQKNSILTSLPFYDQFIVYDQLRINEFTVTYVLVESGSFENPCLSIQFGGRYSFAGL